MSDYVKTAMATYESARDQNPPPPSEPRDTYSPLGPLENGFTVPEVPFSGLSPSNVEAVRGGQRQVPVPVPAGYLVIAVKNP